MRRLVLAATASVLLSCDLFPPVEMSVRANGAWAHDSSAVLLVESRYLTHRQDAAYWAPEAGHHDWRTVIYVAEAGALGDLREIASWPDEFGDSSGGWMQSVPVSWHRDADAGRLFYVSGGRPTVRSLSDGTATILDLPNASALTLLGLPAEEVGVRAVLPSPDGMLTAVLYEVVTADSGAAFGLLFTYAVAFFDRSGTYLAGYAPADRFSLEQLRLEPPPIEPALSNPEPPAFQPYEATPAYLPALFLWAPNSRGVYLVNEADTLTGERQALLIELDQGGALFAMPAATVPERAIPAPGGPVSADGRLLAFRHDPKDSNSAEPFLHQLSSWKDYGSLLLIPLEDESYAL